MRKYRGGPRLVMKLRNNCGWEWIGVLGSGFFRLGYVDNTTPAQALNKFCQLLGRVD